MVKLFVGNLNPKSRLNDLRSLFEPYGKVGECAIVHNYAFVHMENEGDADLAIEKLQGVELDGSKINVEKSHGKRSSGGRTSSGGGGVSSGRDNGPGPMRRRDDRGPSRGRGGGGGGGGGRDREYPPMPYDRYGPPPPVWSHDPYMRPYGPPPRAHPRSDSYDYPPPSSSSSHRGYDGPKRDPYARDVMPPPTYVRDAMPPLPPPQSSRDRNPAPRSATPPRYESYEYDRYREPAPRAAHAPSSSALSTDSYDYNYGSYGSAGAYDYGDRSSGPPNSYDAPDRYGPPPSHSQRSYGYSRQ